MSDMRVDAAEGMQVRQLLRQSLETVLGRHYSFEQRRDAYRSAMRHSAAAWSAYGELGLLAVGLPEEHGGLPGDLAEVAMAAELMGGALVLEPYRAAMVAARLLAAAGTAGQKTAWLPALTAGTRKAVLAYGDPVAAEAVRDGSGWRIDGRVSVIPGGDTADLFIVPARVEEETGLFLIPAEAAGRRPYGCFDWTGAADLVLSGVTVPPEARLAGGEAALALALDEATVLACADAVGAIRAANSLTRDYSRNRRQFGTAIAGFQVLQHRMADMAIAEEAAASITAMAVSACSRAESGERARIVSAARVAVGDAARFVGQQCVQIHGGMGLTEEYPASHYFARLDLFDRMCGSREKHLRRVGASPGNPHPAAV